MQKWIGFRKTDSNANLQHIQELYNKNSCKYLQLFINFLQIITSQNEFQSCGLKPQQDSATCQCQCEAEINSRRPTSTMAWRWQIFWCRFHYHEWPSIKVTATLKKQKLFFPCSYCKAWTYYVVFFKIFQVDILPVYLSVFHAMFSPWALDPKLMQLGFLKVWIPFFIDSSCW